MKRFFDKYPIEACEMDALKMMHKHMKEAKKSLAKGESDREYLEHLAKLHMMISDFFEVKAIPISTML